MTTDDYKIKLRQYARVAQEMKKQGKSNLEIMNELNINYRKLRSLLDYKFTILDN